MTPRHESKLIKSADWRHSTFVPLEEECSIWDQVQAASYLPT